MTVVTSLYPVLTSRDVAAAAAFYREALGFETTYDSDWYVSLRLGEFELAILAHDHPTIPEGYRAVPSGVVVNLEVDDVDAVHARALDSGATEALAPYDMEGVGRLAYVLDPDNNVLGLIQPSM